MNEPVLTEGDNGSPPTDVFRPDLPELAAPSANTDIAARLPAPPPDDRRTWTDAALFVAIHQHRGQLGSACQAIGIRSAKTVRAYAKTHPEFKTALEHELQIALDTRHDLVIKTGYDLAIDGIPKYEYANDGTLLRKTISYDAKHVSWLMEREAPETYHLPSRHEHTGAGGLPIRFKFEMDDGPLNINDRDNDIVDGELEDDADDAEWAAT